MASYGRKVPNHPTCATSGDTSPVAQRIEQGFPKAEAAGSSPAGATERRTNPAGLTPQERLRLAQYLPDPDRFWEALRARLEWIEARIAEGVPRGAAFAADGRLQVAKRLPRERHLAAARAIGAYMHDAKMRASGAAKVWVH